MGVTSNDDGGMEVSEGAHEFESGRVLGEAEPRLRASRGLSTSCRKRLVHSSEPSRFRWRVSGRLSSACWRRAAPKSGSTGNDRFRAARASLQRSTLSAQAHLVDPRPARHKGCSSDGIDARLTMRGM